jgi:nitrogen fixation protein FixH
MKTAPIKRNPWPIAITAYFIVFFSGLVIFIVFATRQHVDLVRADYYEQEIRFQQQWERLNRTGQMSDPAAVAYDPNGEMITIHVPQARLGPVSGQIHFYRPSDARLDRQIPFAPGVDGTQRVDARLLRSGLWKVRVQWMANGQEYYLDHAVVIRARA